ncbi:hypothetical protein [Pseudalkalibacillus salsuginis]|uniref:hypothetical protein n=1 Tax=Pseudalkalibacillus salsuginis TaxID=2910972 RepID=UPI001F1B7A3E|nr:hypothetical protein [Pseudalkalibacillus salsuginis]MCF6410687.1 hypothetical protein [Pseudalkalibacillus salsuginis]
MKKIIGVLIFTLALSSSPFYVQGNIDKEKIKEADYYETKVLHDIAKSFDINLLQYKRYKKDDLLTFSNKEEYMFIFDKLASICKPGCIQSPTFLLKDDEGIIVYKSIDNVNYMVKLRKEKSHWTVIEKGNKKSSLKFP